MKKKILLAVLLVIVLLGAGIGYACFATDVFKTKKQLFFSYLLSDDLTSDLKDKDLAKYLEKEQNTVFSNKGEITANILDNSDSSDVYAMFNNGKITIEGKTDNVQKKSEQEVTVALEQGINVPIQLRRDGEIYGIKTNLLYNKYIAIKNENLKSLVEKLGMEDSEDVPNQIDFANLTFSDSEIKQIKDKYTKVFYNSVENDMLDKEKVDGQTKVTLNMSGEKFVSIVEEMVDTLKKDEKLLNKLSDGTTVEKLKEQLDDFVKVLKDTETSESDKLSIALYIKSNKLVKCEIMLADEDTTETIASLEKEDKKLTIKTFESNEMNNQISISKDTNADTLSYVVNIENTSSYGEKANIQLTMQFKNLSKLESVEENIEAVVKYSEDEDETAIKLNYNNVNTFLKDAEIESFNSDNAIVLNDKSEDEINDLVETIIENLGLN